MIVRDENPQLDDWWVALERLSRGLGRIGPDEICCEGLTSRQCSLLRLLASGDDAVLGELAQRAGISLSGLSRALDRLQAAGLVARVRGTDEDGRAARVQVTGAGKVVLERIDDLMRERVRAMVTAIPRATRPLVWRSLTYLSHAAEVAGGDVLVGNRCEAKSKGSRRRQYE